MVRRIMAAALSCAAAITLLSFHGPDRHLAAGAVAVAIYLALTRHEELSTMSKPNKKRFKLETIRTKHAEKSGDTIEFETDDGQVFALPAPGFWPDEATELMGQNREVALATVLLGGPERYAAFKSAGGRAQDVALVLAHYAEDQGVSQGESGASSAS